MRLFSFLVLILVCVNSFALAQDFGPMWQMETPLPGNISEFVENETAAIALGKAFFWDAQIGGDGVTACATCHFSGGADTRDRNQAHPGAAGTFTNNAANGQWAPADFPFRKLSDPDNADSTVERDSTEVGGSQGVHDFDFTGLSGLLGSGGSQVDCDNLDDDGNVIINPIHSVDGVNVRQTTGRNAPAAVNAIHSVDSFWDGRARSDFNGLNPGGQGDADAVVRKVDADGSICACGVTMEKAALASQATGPIGSDVEMTGAGQPNIALGKKVCTLTPLANQAVSPDDSVLGGMAAEGGGLNTSYVEMIEAAYRPEYWNSSAILDADGTVIDANPDGTNVPEGEDQYSLMEINFTLFWGISVMLYESTLVSDDTPFDRWLAGDTEALSPEAEAGMDAFYSGGLKCAECHSGPLLTAASWDQLNEPGSVGEGPVVEVDGQDESGVGDKGFFNIGVRPVAEDGGRAGVGANTWLSALDSGNTGMLPDAQIEDVDTGDLNMNVGAFKTPTLRNVELTGPFFHNGSQATLKQVVEFYVRGGDFGGDGTNVHKHVNPIGKLRGKEPRQEAVVAFMKALTDERVRWERAPFDHPSLDIPNGAIGDSVSVGEGLDGILQGESSDNMITLPATGSDGRTAAQGPVKAFLEDAGGNGAGTLNEDNDPVINVVCYATADGVTVSWSATTPVDSYVIEIDNGGEFGADVISLNGAEQGFQDPTFRPGVTGYLITPFSLGSELKSSACYIRRGEVEGMVPHFLRGDMNTNGLIDVGDAIEILQGIFSGGQIVCNDSADWNDDGKIDISDPICSLAYLFAGGVAPALPFPQCGSDPSFDSLNCGQLDLCQ